MGLTRKVLLGILLNCKGDFIIKQKNITLLRAIVYLFILILACIFIGKLIGLEFDKVAFINGIFDQLILGTIFIGMSQTIKSKQ